MQRVGALEIALPALIGYQPPCQSCPSNSPLSSLASSYLIVWAWLGFHLQHVWHPPLTDITNFSNATSSLLVKAKTFVPKFTGKLAFLTRGTLICFGWHTSLKVVPTNLNCRKSQRMGFFRGKTMSFGSKTKKFASNFSNRGIQTVRPRTFPTSPRI